MRPAAIGKWVAMGGIVVLVLSLAPLDAGIDPHASWWGSRWQWMWRALRQEPAATRRDRGASTARAAPHHVSHADRAGQIFVGNVAYTVTPEELRQLFAAYGVVEHVHLVTERETGRSRGFAFVTMPHAAEAQDAIAGLHGTTLGGRPLTVSAARPREERRPRW